MAMECNVGGAERWARLGLGAVATGAGLMLLRSMAARIAALGLGVVGLATGLSRHCPLNEAMGRNTCRLD